MTEECEYLERLLATETQVSFHDVLEYEAILPEG